MNKIDSYGYSSIGTRFENEDSYGIVRGAHGVFAIVADGLGGHGGGKAASGMTVDVFKIAGFETHIPENEEWLHRFHQANQMILDNRMNENHMKTTAVCLSVCGNQVRWAHIGDSRLYHFYNEQLYAYTLDHSVSQMAVMLGEITREQIPYHSERSRILKVLGHDEIAPEIGNTTVLRPGRHAFLLCSDGFWESVTEDEMLMDLHKSQTSKDWISFMQHRVMKRLGQDHDNHTAVAVMLNV